MSDEIPINQYLAKMEKTIDRFEEKLDKTNEKLDKNTELTYEFGNQVKVANGRTRKLEDFSVEMKTTMETLANAVQLNRDENIVIKSNAKSKDKTLKWIIGIIAFFIVSFAVMLQENIKNYNQNLINQQLNSAQKKTENPNITNTVSVNN